MEHENEIPQFLNSVISVGRWKSLLYDFIIFEDLIIILFTPVIVTYVLPSTKRTEMSKLS